jgi:hypothetical protein
MSKKSHRHMYICNTCVHIQCKVMYEDSGARDMNCLLSQVQMFKVYTNLYSLAKNDSVSVVM